ncbi:hypothetical protein N7486_009796 [Penicillium sp. IBT 16267x]|nr:hypothetical protein N7486_009796 [Penicillium sp. IBT 16267x]
MLNFTLDCIFGTLAPLMLWALKILGFGELGPIGGSFAAAWQSAYAGFVLKGLNILTQTAIYSKIMPNFILNCIFRTLAPLMAWALKIIGFGQAGPIGGSFAAGWQRAYAGFVPERAWFGFFQKLGMKWH